MTSLVRRLARPLSALLVVAFLAPASMAKCPPPPESGMTAMECCQHAAGSPAMDPNCCAMRQEAPAPGNPATPVTLRSSDQSMPVALAPETTPAVLHAAAPTPHGGANTGPENLDRLYLRLSSIRR